MKKFAILILASTALLLHSCKDDYKCYCGQETSSHCCTAIHDTHGNAQKICQDRQKSYNDTIKCKLF